jgi:CHASE2 domain-containing sensor protein
MTTTPKNPKNTSQTAAADFMVDHLRTVRRALLKAHPGSENHAVIIAIDEMICWYEKEASEGGAA